jgi:hypothetical protein
LSPHFFHFGLIILIIYSKQYKLWNTSLCSFSHPRLTSSVLSLNILIRTLFLNTPKQNNR